MHLKTRSTVPAINSQIPGHLQAPALPLTQTKVHVYPGNFHARLLTKPSDTSLPASAGATDAGLASTSYPLYQTDPC